MTPLLQNHTATLGDELASAQLCEALDSLPRSVRRVDEDEVKRWVGRRETTHSSPIVGQHDLALALEITSCDVGAQDGGDLAVALHEGGATRATAYRLQP